MLSVVLTTLASTLTVLTTALTTSPAAAAGTQAHTRVRAVVEQRVIGHSVQDRPIVAYRKGNPDAARKVVVIGQMHGDERGGVTTANYIKDRLGVSARADVWVIPTMNPDGFAHRRRQNAHGVDLNRNFPTNGWRRGPRGETYPGRRPASEPETRAVMRFLRTVRPRFIASIHQPFGVVSRSDKDLRYSRRLARQLDLPLSRVTVGGCRRCVAPTLTSWYNARDWGGASVTIEYRQPVSVWFRTRKAGPGILRASRAY